MRMVIWHKFTAYRKDLTPYKAFVPRPGNDGALLLWQILSMPRRGKTKMAFETAMSLCLNGLIQHLDNPNETRESCEQYKQTMIAQLSQKGYWIELSGKEFLVIMDSKSNTVGQV